MNSKSNRKIIFAILIMFAITISIIGVAYAYFTVNFKNNSKENSVTVNAGKLIAEFKGTNSIDVKNIFPRWKSDGKTYFDANAIGMDGKLFAKTAPDATTLNSDKTANIATARNGLSDPITFSVSNKSTEKSDINFIIKLKVDKNTFSNTPAVGTPDTEGYVPANEDYKNLKVTLYKGTYQSNFDGTSYTDLPATTATKTFNTYIVPLPTDTQYAELILVDEAQTIDIGGEENYYVVFEYLDDDTNQSRDTETVPEKELSAEVTIIGVEKDDNAGGTNKWYDADNNEVTFSSNDGVGIVSLVDRN